MNHPDITPVLERQRQAFKVEGPVSASVRRERLQAVIDALVAHQDALVEAMREDFRGRPPVFSLMNDILGAMGPLKMAREMVSTWMADESRPSVQPFDQFGATAWIRRQPKGVIGIIGTWNAPVFTLLAPLAGVLAAGNRAVLKPSEVTPRTADAVARMVAQHLSPEVVTVVQGGPDVAQAFCSQPWDHLVFTGSTATGRKVAQAAAQNLVPLTLELGGKSPVLIGEHADLEQAAERIAVGKAQNSGQLCISPDTVWIHRDRADAFVEALCRVYAGLYPSIAGNPDVVPVVNAHHTQRVDRYVEDARARGARVVVAGDLRGDEAEGRLPLRIVIDPPPEAEIACQEIFGPALVVRTTGSLDEALRAIADGPRPLALYVFSQDEGEIAHVLDHSLSGGVSINDVLMHAALPDAPFGGVGESGMGHYLGREGFAEFSHHRSVYRAGTHDPRREWGMLPPYGEHLMPMMKQALTP